MGQNDVDVELNYRQVADRNDLKALCALHDEYLRLIDLAMRRNRAEAEVQRLHRIADVYQQAIEYKESEGA